MPNRLSSQQKGQSNAGRAYRAKLQAMGTWMFIKTNSYKAFNKPLTLGWAEPGNPNKGTQLPAPLADVSEPGVWYPY